MDTKPIPSSPESEEALLGSLLIDRDAQVLITGKLTSEDFYLEKNGMIFTAIQELNHNHTPADFVTLCDKMEREGTLDGVGGREYLTSLLNAVPSAVHIEYYADIIRKCATKRKMIAVAGEIAGLGYNDEDDVEKSLADAEAKWQQVRNHARTEHDIVKNTDAIGTFMERQDEIEKLYRNSGYLCDTPWRSVNNMVYGFQPGNLIIVAAPSGHGKSICGENIAEHNAKRGKKVLYFHLELTTEQMIARQVCRFSDITIGEILKGSADRDQLARVGETVGSWPGAIRYVHCPGWKPERIAAVIRREAAMGLCDLVIIDYLQKVYLPFEKGRTDEMALGLAVETLKNVAEVAMVPVILMSQVNREHLGRTKGPKLTVDDLRGCLSADSIVATPDGGILISAISVGQKIYVCNKDGKIVVSKVKNVWKTGHEKTFVITSTSGTIRATANHPFMREDGWCRADNLRVDDFVAVSQYRRSIVWVRVDSITEHDAEDVWDLETESEDHNFIANGFVVHNSGQVAEKSNMVIMLWNSSVADPDYLGNLVEIIVSKNTFGATGELQLMWSKQHFLLHEIPRREPGL